MTNIGLIGTKIGMSREFFPIGISVPVTVIKIEKGRVIDLITKDKRGYDAIKVGFGKIKTSKLTKSMKGFYSKKSTEPKKYLKEYRVENISNFKEGNEIGLEIFKDVKFVDVTSKSIGKGFAGVMETFDNTRPLVAAMAIGCAKASLERIKEIFKDQLDADYKTPYLQTSNLAAQIYRMEAEWEAARLLMIKATWMADNKKPNSKEASIAKAKAGRVGNDITLKCVELAASVGYSEDELLEKWARDSKILDIFEGTQQIQQLIIARRELGKSSSELK